MNKGAKRESDSANSPRIVNRRASHDYHILEKLETGIVLTGTEVKSIRAGQVSLAQGYAAVDERDGSLVLYGVDIAPYQHAAPEQNHDPKRPRRLLAHKRQIARLAAMTRQRGTTLVPLAMYFVRGKCKVELGLAVGKRKYDRRQDLKERQAQRDIQRGLTRKKL